MNGLEIELGIFLHLPRQHNLKPISQVWCWVVLQTGKAGGDRMMLHQVGESGCFGHEVVTFGHPADLVSQAWGRGGAVKKEG